MNTPLRIILPAVSALLLLSGCKTTEANYKAAYETAAAHQRERTGNVDSPELTQRGALTPSPTTIDGVTLPLATTWITSVKEKDVAPYSSVKKYNVAVARFRQIFNARQMLTRLKADGYPDAFVVKTAEAYFVATETTSKADSAYIGLEKVKADSSLSLRTPFPFILRPGHLAR